LTTTTVLKGFFGVKLLPKTASRTGKITFV